jgi:hypothetical protein
MMIVATYKLDAAFSQSQEERHDNSRRNQPFVAAAVGRDLENRGEAVVSRHWLAERRERRAAEEAADVAQVIIWLDEAMAHVDTQDALTRTSATSEPWPPGSVLDDVEHPEGAADSRGDERNGHPRPRPTWHSYS